MGQDKFTARLLRWYTRHGRHDLPWQIDPTPYRVWISEIMLQQTQVSTVIPYYRRFIERFPDVQTLAGARQDEVLQLWAGLGYYARGRNLHRAARLIVEQYQGQFPDQIEAVVALPGIGRSTAGAILALALGQRHAILDGNVKRSLCRYHGIHGYPGKSGIQAKLWQLAEQHTPGARVADYTQAIMDFGATLCTRNHPACETCPQQPDCRAWQQGEVTELPTPRPRRKRPSKQCHMLALIETESNELLLFKRPDSGIWGGLYSLPEFDSLRSCEEQLSSYTEGIPLHAVKTEPIRHAFTHFDLQITPLSCRLPRADLIALLDNSLSERINIDSNDNSTVYRLPLDAPEAGVGIPAPVQKIVKVLT